MSDVFFSDDPNIIADMFQKEVEKELQEQEKRLAHKHVDIGFFDSAQYQTDSAPYVAHIAAIHNFGSVSRKIPARPFFTYAVTKIRKEVIELYKLQPYIGLYKVHELMGQKVKAAIQNAIVTGPWRPNAPETIRRKETKRARNNKASVKPLIDTGYLRTSVTYRIKK